MSKQEDVAKLLHAFATAFERADWPYKILNSFPQGCGSIASHTLGHLLQDRNLGQWHLVKGIAHDLSTHEWLESSDGWVVDPTCHQFDFGVQPFVARRGLSPMAAYFPSEEPYELSELDPTGLFVYRVIETYMKVAVEEATPRSRAR